MPRFHDAPLPPTRTQERLTSLTDCNSHLPCPGTAFQFTRAPFLYARILLFASLNFLRHRLPWPLAARHCFSTCDHQNANTSPGCSLGLFTRSRTFAVPSTCVHRAITVAPRHRLFAARHQSTIPISPFHWLLACASASHLAVPPASISAPPLNIHSALEHAKRNGAPFASLLVSEWHVAPSTGPRLAAKDCHRRLYQRSSDTDRYALNPLGEYKELD
jgi:hypothetical protein